MNSKMIIVGVIIVIIIGVVFVVVHTDDTNSDLKEIPHEIVEPHQIEGKQFTLELSDSLAVAGP